MKFLSVLLTYLIFAQSAFAGLPPTTASGQADTAKTTTFNYQVPNKQATKVNGATLLETGNKNILTNPSFEHSTVLTGWTLPDSVKTAETSVVIDGKQALKATFIGDPLNLIQDSTLYASQFAGSVQGLASIRIKTAITGLKVCARQAGVTSTSLCVNVASDNKWGLYKIPSILGATSNGIAVTSSGVAVGGDIYFDDAFVGAVDLKVDGSTTETQSSYVSPGSATAAPNNLAGAIASSSGVSTLYSYNSTTGVYTALKNIYVQMDVAIQTSATANVMAQIVANGNGVALATLPSSMGVGWWQSASWEGPLLAGQTIYINTTNGTSGNHKVSLSAKAYNKSSTYSSTNADTDWTSFTPTGTWTTNTTYSGKWKRTGSNMDLSVVVNLTGAPNATAMAINLPSGYTVDESKLPSPMSNFVVAAGVCEIYIGGVSHGGIATYQATANRLLLRSTGVASQSNVNQSNPAAFTNGSSISCKASLPIQGWENSNIIIGQFNGLESCKDSYECEDEYSAFVSSSQTVSNPVPGAWISSVSVITTGQMRVNFVAGRFTSVPQFTVTAEAGIGHQCSWATASTSSVDVYCAYNTTGANLGFTIKAKKTGADYIGKTAKAVASDQNVRSIGSVGVDIQRVFFGSGTNCGSPCTTGTCTICKQVGSKITSVTWGALGLFRMNGLDRDKYICDGTGYLGVNDATKGLINDYGSSSSTYTAVYAGQGNTSHNTVTCIGIP